MQTSRAGLLMLQTWHEGESREPEFPCETCWWRGGCLWKIKHPRSAGMHIAVEIICISFFKAICMSSAWTVPVVSGLGSGAFLAGLWVSWISDASTCRVTWQIQEDSLRRSWGRNPLAAVMCVGTARDRGALSGLSAREIHFWLWGVVVLLAGLVWGAWEWLWGGSFEAYWMKSPTNKKMTYL